MRQGIRIPAHRPSDPARRAPAASDRPAPAWPTAAPAARHDISGVPIADTVQRKAAPGTAGRDYQAPNRTGLPDRLKVGIEALSALSMDDVRVHYNSPEPSRLQAHAYARGTDIYLAPGQERHLPHEAWHVVQQAQGRVRQTSQVPKDWQAGTPSPRTKRIAQHLYHAAAPRSIRSIQDVAQRVPFPESDGKTGRGDRYLDEKFGVILTKLNNFGAFLYKDSHIVYWNGNGYENQDGESIDILQLPGNGERVLNVSQGEQGYIEHHDILDKFTHMQTSNASPCIVLIIHDGSEKKSFLTHIHRGNSDSDVEDMLDLIDDSDTVKVCLITKMYTENKPGELEAQERRLKFMDSHLSKLEKIEYKKIIDKENAILDISTGEITHHCNESVPPDAGLITAIRGLARDHDLNRADASISFQQRRSNVEEGDTVYDQLKKGRTRREIYETVQTIQYRKIPDSTDIVQMVRVYGGPSRDMEDGGFDEEKMYQEFKRSDDALKLEDKVGEMGFKYAGDTASESKANTNFRTKEIKINKNLLPNEAALSFAYELKNASQEAEANAIFDLLSTDTRTREDAEKFANGIIRKEARSVLFRSRVAIALGIEHLIRNQKYNDIAREGKSEEDLEESIFEEMKNNGVVLLGARKAYSHYLKMYWKEHKSKKPYEMKCRLRSI
jgi:Domain of unknown function (DUF4157)